MRVVVALGGNALLRRDQAPTDENQEANIALAADQLAPIAAAHELVVSHGNGPQVGLLALQEAAFESVPAAPLDVLGAETQGMIGYLLTRELGNRLPFAKPIAVLLTMIEVDPDDPAFGSPTKPIGPGYDRDEADVLEGERGWTFRPDGDQWRRVVPSPRPKRIFERRQIEWLLDQGSVVICAGGGGIPTMYREGRTLVGVEAVIDKDHASGLLARGISADCFVMATDADGIYEGWGTDQPRLIAEIGPDRLETLAADFPAGSMRPKAEAAIEFVRATGRDARIGRLRQISAILDGTAGTRVAADVTTTRYREEPAA
jgi:carbamate kinase